MTPKLSPIFWGKVVDGRLVIHDIKRLHEYLIGLHGEVEITIRKWRPNRTLNQNAYYWVLLALVAEHTGLESEEVHQTFEQKFLTYRFPPIFSLELKRIHYFFTLRGNAKKIGVPKIILQIPSAGAHASALL